MRTLLELEIQPGCDSEEYDDVSRRYWICSQALDDFLGQKISFDDYLSILGSNGVLIDDYCGILEYNFEL